MDRASVQHLLVPRADLRHRLLHLPYVFVLVANALDRTPSELEDASSIPRQNLGPARRVTIRWCCRRLLAGPWWHPSAMTLFGSPAILALPPGFHT